MRRRGLGAFAFALAIAGALLVSGSGGRASARVIMAPSIVHLCPGGPSWDKVQACLARHGRVLQIKTEGDAKLVQLDYDPSRPTAAANYRVAGLYLYVHEGGHEWSLGGMYLGTHRVVGLSRARYGTFNGYRIDLADSRVGDHVALEGLAYPALIREKVALFCGGSSTACGAAMIACDVYVGGQAYWMFRGALEYVDGHLYVRGDRSNTGGQCGASEEVFLPASVDEVLD